MNSRRSYWQLASVLAPLILVAGCVSTKPPPPPGLDTPVPAEWSASDTAASRAEEGPWWSSFGDEDLDRVVTSVLERNRDLLAAVARVDAAAAQARIAGADLAPQIAAGLDASKQRQTFIGLPIPGREGEPLSTTSQSFGVALNISWEIDLWGRLRAQKKAAVLRSHAAVTDLEAVRLSLAGQAAKAWFAHLEALEQVALEEATLANRQLTSRRIQRRYEMGVRPALDLRLALTNEAAAEASLALRQQQLDASQRQLDLLISAYPDGVLEVEASTPVLPDPHLRVKPEILGGAVIRAGDTIYDGSLRRADRPASQDFTRDGVAGVERRDGRRLITRR